MRETTKLGTSLCRERTGGTFTVPLMKSGSLFAAILCVLFIVLVPNRATADGWLQFRGPGGLGISKEMGLPVTWSAGQNLFWKIELPGAGASSPIVVGDRIFLTCYSGYGVPSQRNGSIGDLKRHVLCLRLADGSVAWQKEIPVAQPEPPRVAEHGYASSTSVSNGERLYVFLGRSGVFAFDVNGKKLWQADVGTGTHGWGSAASPVLYKDLVIVNASVESQSLVALHKQTGKEVWRVGGIRQAWNTPHLAETTDGKTELVIGIEGKLLGLDPDKGEQLWNCDGNQGYICPSPLASNGIVYALWGRRTLGVRLGGRGEVGRTHQLWNFWRNNAGSNVSSPIYYNGHLYFASESNGSVYCMDAQTGMVVYQKRLSPNPGKIYASPVLTDGKLYYVSRTGGAFVIAAKPVFEQLAHNDLGNPSIFDASPAVVGGRLLLRSDRCLYCIGTKWQQSL